MIKVALKGLLGRKLRALLTGLAIVLGVAMISGTYVLTDTIKAAFSTVFTTVYAKTDAVVTGKNALGQTNNSGLPPSFPESLLGQVKNLPGVADASGGITDLAYLVGHDGKVVSGHGAPPLAFSVHPHGNQRFNPLTLTEGGWPVGPHQVDIDANTASKNNYKVGDTIGVIARGPEQKYRIAGIVEIGGVASLGGATMAIFDFPTAQRIFDKVGRLDSISIAAKPGTTPAGARQRDQADPAEDGAGPHGRGRGRAGDEGHERLPLDLQRLPARIRRRRALRRHFRDREHALDHRDSANARTCDAADARRLQAAGADVCPRGGRRDRRRSLR